MNEVIAEKIGLKVGDGTNMAAFVARPKDEAAHPGLIVFQEAFGVNAHIRDIAERFAREGYIAVAPALYHRTGPGFEGIYDDPGKPWQKHQEALTSEGLETDIQAAYDWLKNFPKIDGERIGSIGFCMGGRVSYLANSILPLKAAVSFYGGGIASEFLDRATHLNGPMLFFWGGEDSMIPKNQRLAIAKALDENKKTYVNVEFSAAGHGFFCDMRKSYKRESALPAWALVKEFLVINV